MGKNKNAQISLAIVLVIIVIIVLAAALIILILKPGLFTAQAVKETQTTTNTNANQIVCNYPYIQVGNSCCLDKNMNSICDSDETQISTSETSELTCQSPYMKKGSVCCLDEDRNGVCDSEEEDNQDIDVRSSSLDDPFDISGIDIYTDEISIRIKNIGDRDYVITNIDVDRCDDKDFDRTIKEDERKSFSLECDSDFGKRSRDVDITVEYKEVGGNVTMTSDGSIDFRVL